MREIKKHQVLYRFLIGTSLSSRCLSNFDGLLGQGTTNIGRPGGGGDQDMDTLASMGLVMDMDMDMDISDQRPAACSCRMRTDHPH